MIGISIISSKLGPNERQLKAFKSLVDNEFLPSKHIFRIGMDKADVQISKYLVDMGFTLYGYQVDKRDHQIAFPDIKSQEALPLKDRNEKLISESQIIIGLPQYFNESEDSPFWKTVRTAMMNNDKELYIVSPHGYCWEPVY